MASGLAVYVSRGGYPLAAQDSLPGAGQALLDGLSTRRAPMKGFKLTSCSLSSFPKLLGTIPFAAPTLPRGNATSDALRPPRLTLTYRAPNGDAMRPKGIAGGNSGTGPILARWII